MSRRRVRTNRHQPPANRGAARQASRRPHSQCWVVLALFLFCLAFYAQTWRHDFAWDDVAYHLAANEALMNGDASAFSSRPYQDFYSPVVYTVWIWLKVFSAPDQGSLRPELFHVANTVLHAANAALVFWLLRAITGFGAGSVLGALVFAIHPLQVESVAWVSELRGLLATFFSLVALIFYWRSRVTLPQARWWSLAGGSVVAFALALLSKPSVSGLPLVLVVIEVVVGSTLPTRRRWLIPSTWGIVALPMIVITKSVQPDLDVDYVPQFAERLMVATDAYAHYVLTLFWPTALSASYGRTPRSIAAAWTPFVSWVIPISLAIAAYRWRLRLPWVAVSAVFVAAAVLPVSGIVPFKGQNFSTVADRYFYLAMPGVALGVALVTQRFARSRWFWAMSIAILIMLGGLNLRQQAVWRNDLTLFGHIVQQYPGQPRVHNNYGVALQAAGRHEAAIQQFSAAIQQRPTSLRPVLQ